MAIFLLVIGGTFGIGYAMRYGVHPYVAPFQHAIGVEEDVILFIVMMLLATSLRWWGLRAPRPARKS